MQGRNIAEANENFWVIPDDVEIDTVYHSHDTVTAAGAPHGCRFRIGEGGHELCGTRCIVASQVTARAIDIAVRFNAKAAVLNSNNCSVDSLTIHGPCRYDDANRISWLECSRLDRRHHREFPSRFGMAS